MKHKKLYLWIEYLFLFFGLPLSVVFLQSRMFMFGLLWFATISVLIYLKKGLKRNFIEELNFSGFKKGARAVIMRFMFFTPLMFAFMYFAHEDELFSFPKERPTLYLYVMIWYPLLSVLPQELIYKTLYFGRYENLYQNKVILIISCAVAFGFMHIILLNWLPVAITALGGLLMAHTYEKTRSLALVSFEHALYGCWAFTIGMGIYFYTGAAWGQM